MPVHDLGKLTSARSLRLRRRDVIQQSLAAVAAGTAAHALGRRGVAAAQETDAQTVGRGPAGGNGFEFVGTIAQQGFDFTFDGFMTRVAGIDPALLFTGTDPANRTPDTARLLLHGVATATSRTVQEPLFIVNGEGEMTIFFNEAGGVAFGTPEAFQQGVEVARGPLSIQNVITVIAPATGLANGNGRTLFGTVSPFTLGDEEFIFRVAEPAWRLNFVGHGTLLDPDLPESVVTVAGNASLTG